MHHHKDQDCLPERELDRLTNEQLVDYIVEMREAARHECLKPALAVLAYGYWDWVHYRVVGKIPTEDVDDVTGTVIESALTSAYEGKSVGEFVNWLKRITGRRIADYYRERGRHPDTEPLVTEHEGEEEVFGDEPATGDAADEIAFRECVGRVLERRNEVHQRVIQLYGPNELGFLGYSARECAKRVEELHRGQEMSEANVHQIWKRFKTDLEEELGLGS